MPVCVIHSPASQHQARTPATRPWSDGRTSHVLRTQRNLLSVFCFSPSTRECLLTHVLLFRKPRRQIHTAEKTHRSLFRLFTFGARAGFERSRSSGGCELEAALWVSGLDLRHRGVCYQEKFFTGVGSSAPVKPSPAIRVPAERSHHQARRSCELMLSSVHHLCLVERFQPKKFLVWCFLWDAEEQDFSGISYCTWGCTRKGIPTSVTGNSVTGWFRTVLCTPACSG